jgi:hypothetical protein
MNPGAGLSDAELLRATRMNPGPRTQLLDGQSVKQAKLSAYICVYLRLKAPTLRQGNSVFFTYRQLSAKFPR